MILDIFNIFSRPCECFGNRSTYQPTVERWESQLEDAKSKLRYWIDGHLFTNCMSITIRIYTLQSFMSSKQRVPVSKMIPLF